MATAAELFRPVERPPIKPPQPSKDGNPVSIDLFKPVGGLYPPPPFRGPHKPESIEKNRQSNTGKKRSPEFGSRVSQIMRDLWATEGYREKRRGIKRKHSVKTKEKISQSLKERWSKDKKYRRRMLVVRNSPEWQARLQQNLERIREQRKPEREERIATSSKKSKILRAVKERGKLDKKQLGLLKRAI